MLRCLLFIHPRAPNGASAIKCCYAAAGSGTGAEESGLRAPVSRKNSIRNHKGIVVAKKMSRKVSRRVVRPRRVQKYKRTQDLLAGTFRVGGV